MPERAQGWQGWTSHGQSTRCQSRQEWAGPALQWARRTGMDGMDRVCKGRAVVWGGGLAAGGEGRW